LALEDLLVVRPFFVLYAAGRSAAVNAFHMSDMGASKSGAISMGVPRRG
jgi:hypothetical protein